MQYFFMVLCVLGITAADQLSKYLVVQNIPLYSDVPVINGLFHLTYVQNTGAAFSMFQGMQWMFLVLFAILTVVVVWDFAKQHMPFTQLERWLIVCIYGGGLGNMIDRVRLGYVVDMIEVEFMDFAVFNVADCFITCGCILLMLHLIFFNKEFWKDERKK